MRRDETIKVLWKKKKGKEKEGLGPLVWILSLGFHIHALSDLWDYVKTEIPELKIEIWIKLLMGMYAFVLSLSEYNYYPWLKFNFNFLKLKCRWMQLNESLTYFYQFWS